MNIVIPLFNSSRKERAHELCVELADQLTWTAVILFLTDFPGKSSSRAKAPPPTFQPHILIMNNSSKSARLDAAVSAFKRGEFIDYSAAVREYNVSRTAVLKRVCRITSSRAEVNSNLHQALTTLQEEVLIIRINYLSGRGLPPTTTIIKNLAEEIQGVPVGKN